VGNNWARPRRVIDRDELLRLKAEGVSLRQISKKLGIGYGTVRLRVRNMESSTGRRTK
jgi:DNA-binding NarL/FixJ family response regulator